MTLSKLIDSISHVTSPTMGLSLQIWLFQSVFQQRKGRNAVDIMCVFREIERMCA